MERLADHLFVARGPGLLGCKECGRSQGDHPAYMNVRHGGFDSAATREEINHPQHYGGDTVYEAIKVIEAWKLGFCLGNTVKYICRAGNKEGSSELVDLRKALWYLSREVQRREDEEKDSAQKGA